MIHSLCNCLFIVYYEITDLKGITSLIENFAWSEQNFLRENNIKKN